MICISSAFQVNCCLGSNVPCLYHLDEIVKPERPKEQPDSGVQVYVGGVPGDMSTYPTLNGCIRGLKIGDTVFDLQEAAAKTTSNSFFAFFVGHQVSFLKLPYPIFVQCLQ